MKKTIKFLLVLLSCIVLAGCGENSGDDAGNVDIKTDIAGSKEDTSGNSTAGNDKVTEDAGTAEDSENAATEEQAYIPKFEGTTVDGEKFSSDSFADTKLTMVNVWATYCSPCLNEMPYLGEIAASYDESEFRIIGVVCDVEENASEKDIEYVKELIESTKADYTHLLLGDSLYTNLVGGVYVVPTTFFFNQKGECLGYLESAYPKETWVQLIEKLLTEVE